MASSGRGEGRTYGGVGSEERRAERRRRLVEAGIRAFGREGFAATTTRSLCAEAGLTQRYFYEAFDGLESLFLEVCRTLATQLKEAILAALADVPREPEPMIRAALEAYFRSLEENPDGARVGLIEAFTVSRSAEMLVRQTIEELAAILQATVQSFDHPRPPGDARLLTIGLVG
ncbi:MAG: TetR/AcrR family transcriptional regulator, partial [Polyangiaceae bacterium]|nr:TetR/AcrR family transcriptional regulator [Polyangiaceae bacterium]